MRGHEIKVIMTVGPRIDDRRKIWSHRRGVAGEILAHDKRKDQCGLGLSFGFAVLPWLPINRCLTALGALEEERLAILTVLRKVTGQVRLQRRAFLVTQ